jgi:sarcosine oxidase
VSEQHTAGVVGAGIVGLCTAYALAERGIACRVYESGVPGNGQSGGESRIFRHAHEDPRLAALARDSRAVWREWGERLGVELVADNGVVALGPGALERLRLLEGLGDSPARRIHAEEVARRLPLLAAYDGPAVLDEGGGTIRTGAAVDALTRALGDTLVADEVILLRPTGRGTVEVRSGGAEAEHSSVVVCAGRATPALARGVGLSIPLRQAAHVRLTFAVTASPPSTRIACLQDSSGAFGEVGVYGTPMPGNERYCLGLSATMEVSEDGSVIDAGALESLARRASEYVGRALPGLDPDPVGHRHCWVTDLPWSDDGVAVWEADRIFFVAGHNLYKQAPGLGRALAAAAAGEPLADGLRPEARLGEPRAKTLAEV